MNKFIQTWMNKNDQLFLNQLIDPIVILTVGCLIQEEVTLQ